MASEEESIEQAAAARREMLRTLRAAQELLETPGGDDSAKPDGDDSAKPDADDETDEQGNPSMKFRNYVPHDKQLQEGKVAPPVLPKFEDPAASVPPPPEIKQDPLVNIAPKKPNWDLRRDVQKKLDKLERRTQKALYKLTEMQEQEKLLTENDSGNAVED